jgi:hypothetical protein
MVRAGSYCVYSGKWIVRSVGNVKHQTQNTKHETHKGYPLVILSYFLYFRIFEFDNYYTI